MATNSDEVIVKLIEIIESGMPEFRHLLPTELRPYHQYRDSLYTVDGVVMYNERRVIPPSLRSSVLESLHAAHQGVSSMISRAEHASFGLESLQPSPTFETAATTVKGRRLLNRALHLLTRHYRSTHSNVSVLTSSHTKELAISSR